MKIHNKVVLSFIAVALICGGFLLTAKVPSLAAVYQTFVFGCLTALGIHHASDFGANYLNTPSLPQLPTSAPSIIAQTDTSVSSSTSQLPGPTI